MSLGENDCPHCWHSKDWFCPVHQASLGHPPQEALERINKDQATAIENLKAELSHLREVEIVAKELFEAANKYWSAEDDIEQKASHLGPVLVRSEKLLSKNNGGEG